MEKIAGEYGAIFNTVDDPMNTIKIGEVGGVNEAASPSFLKANGLDAVGNPIKSNSMFAGAEGIGSTMQGIGAIAGAAAGIYDAYNKKKYQDKVFGMEEQRVARATQRQDKQQAAYDKVFG